MHAPADQESRIERRRTPRYDAATLGRVSVRLLGGTEVQLINFSEGGLLFQSETRLLVGARATVRIVRGTETVVAVGTVVRSLVQGMVSGTLQFQTAVALEAPLALATAVAAAMAQPVAPPTGTRAQAPAAVVSEVPLAEAPAALTRLPVCFVSTAIDRTAVLRQRLAAHADVVLDSTHAVGVAAVTATASAHDVILVDGALAPAALGALMAGLRAAPLGASLAILVPERVTVPADVTALANACIAEGQPADALAEALRDAAWTPWQPVTAGSADREHPQDGLFGGFEAPAALAPPAGAPAPHRSDSAAADDRAALVAELAALRERVTQLERDLGVARAWRIEVDAQAADLQARHRAAEALVRARTHERDTAVAHVLQVTAERDAGLDRLSAERQRAEGLASQLAAIPSPEAVTPVPRSRRILGEEESGLSAPRLQRMLEETRAELQHERDLRRELEAQLDENAEALERTVQAYEARLDLSSR